MGITSGFSKWAAKQIADASTKQTKKEAAETIKFIETGRMKKEQLEKVIKEGNRSEKELAALELDRRQLNKVLNKLDKNLRKSNPNQEDITSKEKAPSTKDLKEWRQALEKNNNYRKGGVVKKPSSTKSKRK